MFKTKHILENVQKILIYFKKKKKEVNVFNTVISFKNKNKIKNNNFSY
jgi:hypothetical protein